MNNLDLTTEQLKDILDDTLAVRKRYIQKAEDLSEAGEYEEARKYCKAVSHLSEQVVRFYELYTTSLYGA